VVERRLGCGGVVAGADEDIGAPSKEAVWWSGAWGVVEWWAGCGTCGKGDDVGTKDSTDAAQRVPTSWLRRAFQTGQEWNVLGAD